MVTDNLCALLSFERGTRSRQSAARLRALENGLLLCLVLRWPCCRRGACVLGGERAEGYALCFAPSGGPGVDAWACDAGVACARLRGLKDY